MQVYGYYMKQQRPSSTNMGVLYYIVLTAYLSKNRICDDTSINLNIKLLKINKITSLATSIILYHTRNNDTLFQINNHYLLFNTTVPESQQNRICTNYYHGRHSFTKGFAFKSVGKSKERLRLLTLFNVQKYSSSLLLLCETSICSKCSPIKVNS